jgi:hypothetical protein
VDAAALDGGAGHHRADGLAEPEVGVAKPRTSRRPSPYTGGHHRVGDDAAVDPGLAAGGIHEHIREGLPASERSRNARPQRPGRRRSARPGSWRCRCRHQGPRTRSSALRVETPCKYASMTTANRAWSTRRRRSNKLGKNDPARSLGIRSSKSQPWSPTPLAGGRCAGPPIGRALVRSSAEHLCELGLDQGLVDGLGGLADAVIHLRNLACVQDLQQCRLVKSHRALCPFASTMGVVSLTIARWPLCWTELCRRGPTTYTTRWDATVQVQPSLLARPMRVVQS